jgi:hypothetical protein
MLVDAESMPQVDTTAEAKRTALTESTASEIVEASEPTTTQPATTKPPTTPAPTKPPTTKPTTTQPPEPTTTLPPETDPTTTLPPETKPTTTLPPETRPTTTLPPETLPTTTLPPETLPRETRPPEPSIAGFVLIDAQSDTDLMWLSDGAVLSLDEIGNNLSIRAEVTEVVGSVVWSINGEKFRVENDDPYALAGNKGDNYSTVKFKPGTYTFTAQMYSKRGGRGEAGQSLTMTVTFTGGADD